MLKCTERITDLSGGRDDSTIGSAELLTPNRFWLHHNQWLPVMSATPQLDRASEWRTKKRPVGKWPNHPGQIGGQ